MQQRHWEIAWTSLEPLSDDEVERSVDAISRLGCSWTQFSVECLDERYVCVRHREDDELLLEFGFAQNAPRPAGLAAEDGRVLVDRGQIAWNWCCTGGRQPETGLILYKWRQVQQICHDKLLVWDDDGQCYWSWGSCPVEQSGLDPERLVDDHLRRWPARGLRRAS